MQSPKKLLAEKGLAAHKDLGQNFLADPGVARHIVDTAGLKAGDAVVEIGPGLGALTLPLLENGCRVLAVEVDRGLARYLEENLQPLFPELLSILNADILRVDFGDLAGQLGGCFHVVANLPYQISTPVLFKLLANRSLAAGAILMFQKELAQRLIASPGGKDYGRLTVMLGYYARLERLMDVSPESFHPRPKIVSTVLRFSYRDKLEPSLDDEALFSRVVAGAFSQRRKTLRNALQAGLPEADALAALALADIDSGRRAETLSVEEFVRLANAFSRQIKG